MSKQDDKRRKAKYTLEFKLQAVRLVKCGQEAAVTTRVLGIPKATLGNWIMASEKGELQGAVDGPVSAEQMELARLTFKGDACGYCRNRNADWPNSRASFHAAMRIQGSGNASVRRARRSAADSRHGYPCADFRAQ